MKPLLPRIGRTISLAIGLSLAVLSFAEDAPASPEKTPENASPAREDSDSTKSEGTKAVGGQRPKPDFTPSEEISEDLSVPFPADI